MTDRASKIQATKAAALDAVFGGKTFTLVSEVDMPDGQVFKATFGQNGKHAYILRDNETGDMHVVGTAVYRQLKERITH